MRTARPLPDLQVLFFHAELTSVPMRKFAQLCGTRARNSESKGTLATSVFIAPLSNPQVRNLGRGMIMQTAG